MDGSKMTFKLDTFIDIHTHILPGLDDGPLDMEGAVALARCYERVGIKSVVATPHYLPGTAWVASKEKIFECIEQLQLKLEDENIDLYIQPGMEIAYHKKTADNIVDGKLLPLGSSGCYLIEPPLTGDQHSLLEGLLELSDLGMPFILAHPERVETFQRKTVQLERLLERGWLLQINTGSLLGYFGRRSKETAEKLLKNKHIHFVASDAHDHKRRPPLNESEWACLIEIPEVYDLLDFVNSNISKYIFRN
jgi:protein-tyrosine phosphatase